MDDQKKVSSFQSDVLANSALDHLTETPYHFFNKNPSIKTGQNLLLSNHAQAEFVKQWMTSVGLVEMFYTNGPQLYATVTEGEEKIIIDPTLISGIPSPIKKDVNFLKHFLQDSWINLNECNDGSYSLHVYGRVYGGAVTDGPPVNVPSLLERISKLNVYTDDIATGRDLVLVVGNTGSGKSTFVNYLAGREMKDVTPSNSTSIRIDAVDPIMEIGHGNNSLTSEPQVYYDADTGLTYCDCPGFFDNRGAEFDISNAYAIKSMLNKAHRLTAIVVLVNYHTLRADRARGLRETADILMQTLGVGEKDISAFRDSILMLVTKGPYDNLNEEYDTEVLREVIMASGHEIFKNVITRIDHYDPLDTPENVAQYGAINRETILQKLNDSEKIDVKTSNLFGLALGKDSLNSLHKLVGYLSSEISQHFEEKAYVKVNDLVTLLDSLRTLSSHYITDAFNRVSDMIRGKIRTFEGGSQENEDQNDEENLAQLYEIKETMTYFQAQAEASINVIETRITNRQALEEQRQSAEAAQNASEAERDAATAKLDAANTRLGQTTEALNAAQVRARELEAETKAKEQRLHELRSQVRIREIHHHHPSKGCSVM